MLGVKKRGIRDGFHFWQQALSCIAIGQCFVRLPQPPGVALACSALGPSCSNYCEHRSLSRVASCGLYVAWSFFLMLSRTSSPLLVYKGIRNCDRVLTFGESNAQCQWYWQHLDFRVCN
eukprot:6188459-Pleurochrysis_carterae.AAC.5